VSDLSVNVQNQGPISPRLQNPEKPTKMAPWNIPNPEKSYLLPRKVLD